MEATTFILKVADICYIYFYVTWRHTFATNIYFSILNFDCIVCNVSLHCKLHRSNTGYNDIGLCDPSVWRGIICGIINSSLLTMTHTTR